MITWHSLAYCSSLFAFLLMLAIVLIERKVYLGFTVMAFMFLAVSSNSSVLYAKLTAWDPTWLKQERAESIVLNAFGDLCFCAGVITAIVVVRPRAGMSLRVSVLFENWRALIFLFVIGASASFLLPLASRIPSFSSIQSQLAWLSSLALICAIYDGRSGFVLYGMFAAWLVICIMQVVQTVHIGNLFYILQLGLVLLFGKRITWSRAVWSFVFAFLFLLLIGTWFQVRGFIRNGGIDNASTLSDKFTMLVREELKHPFVESNVKTEFSHIWMWRVDFSEYYMNERSWVPSHEPYAGWSTVFPSVWAAIIPRAIWPEKPMSQGGTEYINRFAGWDFDPATVSFDMAFPFEFYAMFGTKGLAVGMFSLGLVIAYFERVICLRRWSISSTMVALAILESLYTGGDQIRLRVTVLAASVGLFFLLGLVIEGVIELQKNSSTKSYP